MQPDFDSFTFAISFSSLFERKLIFDVLQVIRYVQLAAGDVDTEMLQDAARQQSKDGAKA